MCLLIVPFIPMLYPVEPKSGHGASGIADLPDGNTGPNGAAETPPRAKALVAPVPTSPTSPVPTDPGREPKPGCDPLTVLLYS
ncbi:hypothetical protein FB566_4620 [Stackebrandtia endophytica]|uniref:Uncharacterized protein n=1 Tax=Stackebrandtia endophytica TaxID=1496996 RepID=A0A543B2P8_9ACTN|nr:hypothetical protein FB566_4620 [Stackebrandtia endophytica]